METYISTKDSTITRSTASKCDVYFEGYDAWDEYIATGVLPENPFEKGNPQRAQWQRGWNLNRFYWNKKHSI